MTGIFTFEQIQAAVGDMDFFDPIANGFVDYSNGRAVVPPVGELVFDDPPGDTHIKYGYIKGNDTYVIKIASGFYDNPGLGLSSSSGLMLVFSQKTGILEAILLDDGLLTNIRTAVAGQICARYLAPKKITAIGVIGTGIQARMQVEYLKNETPCRQVVVWGRNPVHVETYQLDMEEKGFEVECASSPEAVARQANLIITATPSKEPLLFERDIRPGTHITAMGSDTPDKQELEAEVLAAADWVVADSLSQCRSRGEIFKAVTAGVIKDSRILELGAVIREPSAVDRTQSDITVADLTGVAVQDVQIATAVCRALRP